MTENRKLDLLYIFQNDGGSGLSDRDLIELIILIANPRADYKKLSDDILQEFKNLSEATNASFNKLRKIKGITENLAAAFKVINICGIRAAEENIKEKDFSILTKWDDFLDYCRQSMAYGEVEEFRIFLLDKDLHCFYNKLISKGTVNQTVAHPREIARFAMDKNAANVILAHNHPSGGCKPSDDDNSLTKDITEALRDVGINVFDHLIITRGPIYSFRKDGFFEENLLNQKKHARFEVDKHL